MITCQICSSVRRSSQAGIAEFHGVDSRGSPGPPFAIRQKRYASWSIAIVRGSWKSAGGGQGMRVGGELLEARSEHDGDLELEHAPERGGPDAKPQEDEGERDDEDRRDRARAEQAHAGISSA